MKAGDELTFSDMDAVDFDRSKVQVVSYGVQRSGSTWVYQILRDLLPPGSVVKTHSYLDLPESVPVVATVRDFRDCAVSHWRQRNPGREKMTREELFLYAGIYQQAAWILGQYVERRNVATIRYEDAIRNPESMVVRIALHLGMSISARTIDELLTAHSLKAHRKALAEGRGAELGLLENHIHEGRPGTWRRFVDEADLLTELLKEPLGFWDYRD